MTKFHWMDREYNVRDESFVTTLEDSGYDSIFLTFDYGHGDNFGKAYHLLKTHNRLGVTVALRPEMVNVGYGAMILKPFVEEFKDRFALNLITGELDQPEKAVFKVHHELTVQRQLMKDFAKNLREVYGDDLPRLWVKGSSFQGVDAVTDGHGDGLFNHLNQAIIVHKNVPALKAKKTMVRAFLLITETSEEAQKIWDEFPMGNMKLSTLCGTKDEVIAQMESYEDFVTDWAISAPLVGEASIEAIHDLVTTRTKR